MGTLTVDESTLWQELKQIIDPEIPTINLVDLGVIDSVHIGQSAITVEMMPTFIGCPALDMMQRDIKARLAPYGKVEVKVIYHRTWTTARISDAGRKMLKEAGFAPPPQGDFLDPFGVELPIASAPVACPHCGSTNTQRENAFGPTPCRQIYYCNDCRQPFERFKAV